MDSEGARNVMSLLSSHPWYYRNFGLWWFGIKRMLRAAGYDLGAYDDPAAAPYMADLTDEQIVAEAVEVQIEAAQTQRNSPHHMTPDGEPFTVWDENMETGAWLS